MLGVYRDICRQFCYVLGVIFLAANTFFVNYYLSQKLSINDYGVFGLIAGVLPILMSVILMGQATTTTMVIFSDKNREEMSIGRELINSLQIISIAYAIVTIVGLVSLCFFKVGFNYTFVLLLIFAAYCVALREFFFNLVVCVNRYKFYLFSIVLYVCVVAICVLFKPAIESYLLGLIIGGMLLLVLLLLMTYLNGNKFFVSRGVADVFSRKRLLMLGWVAIPGMLISMLNAYIDRYVINFFMGLQQVAYYTLAATLSVGIGNTLVNALLKSNIVVSLKSIQNGEIHVYKKIVFNTLIVLSVVLSFAVLGYYTAGKFLLKEIFGIKYSSALPYLLSLFIVTILNGLANFYSMGLVQRQKIYILVLIGVVLFITNLILNIILINIVGVKGCILALYLTAALNLCLVVFVAKRYFSYIKFPVVFFIGLSCLLLISLVFSLG